MKIDFWIFRRGCCSMCVCVRRSDIRFCFFFSFSFSIIFITLWYLLLVDPHFIFQCYRLATRTGFGETKTKIASDGRKNRRLFNSLIAGDIFCLREKPFFFSPTPVRVNKRYCSETENLWNWLKSMTKDENDAKNGKYLPFRCLIKHLDKN